MSKVLQNGNDVGRAAKASFWFLVCNMIQKGMTAVCTPIYTRIMDSDAFGEYTVYLSWYQIVSIFVTLNLSAGVINNALTDNYEDSKRIGSSFLGLSTIVACIILGIYWLLPNFWNGLFSVDGLYINLMILEAVFSGAYAIWAAMERYDYEYKGILITCILSGIVGTIVTIGIVIMSPHKALALIVTYAFIQIAIGLFFYVRLMSNGRCFFSKQYWKFALSFNLPLIPHYVSYILLNQSDRIMIDRFIGKSATALYGVAYSISMIMMTFVTAINNTLIPYIYKSIRIESFERIQNLTKQLMIFCFIGCLGVMLLGPELIKVFASNDYYEAAYIIPSVAAAVYFMFGQSLIGTVAFYFKKTKFVMFATTIAAVLNVALNYVFIPQFGYIAAAYTTLFSYFVLMGIHYIFYKYLCKKQLSNRKIFSESSIWGGAVMLIILVPFISSLYEYLIIRWCIVIIVFMVLVINRKLFASLYQQINKGRKDNE